MADGGGTGEGIPISDTNPVAPIEGSQRSSDLDFRPIPNAPDPYIKGTAFLPVEGGTNPTLSKKPDTTPGKLYGLDSTFVEEQGQWKRGEQDKVDQKG